MKRIDVALAVICRQRSVLICRRRQQDRFGGYWEFPGGKIEAGETLQEGLARELREELDIVAEPLVALPTIDHDYPDIQVRLHPFLCSFTSGQLRPLGCNEAIWIDAAALPTYQFPPANEKMIGNIVNCLLSDSAAFLPKE